VAPFLGPPPPRWGRATTENPGALLTSLQIVAQEEGSAGDWGACRREMGKDSWEETA